MDNKKTSKIIYKFNCESCNFKCVKKGDYSRHLTTSKHTRIMEDNIKIKIVAPPPTKPKCVCGKEYTFMSGLCKHKKRCEKANETENISISNNELLMKIIQDNNEFKTLLIKQNDEINEQKKIIMDLCKEKTIIMNTTTNNTTTNNRFNINLFLNEQCKNAMNIMEFVNSMKIDLVDLENLGKLGFIEGISKLMIRELKCMDIYKRPIHCSDTKRETIYVKDENKWEKENENKSKIKCAIKKVAHKNVLLIPSWRDKFPYSNNEMSKKNDEFNNIIISTMGGNTTEEDNEFHNKIIKNVIKEINIKQNLK
jgi:hypothetical protein